MAGNRFQITLSKELVQRVREYSQEHNIKAEDERGAIQAAIRYILTEHLKREEQKRPIEPQQRMKHMNVFDDHVILRDNLLGRIVFVYTRNGNFLCDLCEATDCLHVKYTKTIPKIKTRLEGKKDKEEEEEKPTHEE